MSYRGKSVFITGADGFIGSHLAEALVRGGARVTALALYQGLDQFGWLDDLPEDIRSTIRRVRGDIRDSTMMLRLTENVDIIFHLAALIAIPHSFDAPLSYIEVNVEGTGNILEAARIHGTPRLIHTSTSEVYGTAQVVPISEQHPLVAQSPYAASKIAADKLAESYALSFNTPVAVLRPFNTYGPRQSERAVISSTIRQALDPNCEAIQLGDTSTIRDFNYVADTVEAFLAIGTVPAIEFGHAYNAGSGVGITIEKMVDLVSKITGTNKPVRTESSRMRPANAEVRELIADSQQFVSATGWHPRFDLEKGLEQTVSWWRNRVVKGQMRADAAYIR